MGDAVFTGALDENRPSHHQPKLEFKGADLKIGRSGSTLKTTIS
jgi:hypothetical protein